MWMKKKVSLVVLLIFMLGVNTVWAADIWKIGDKNWKITLTQRRLNALDIKTDRDDGLFSKDTEKAIKEFQKKYKLKVTGQLDDSTYKAINEQVIKKYGSLDKIPNNPSNYGKTDSPAGNIDKITDTFNNKEFPTNKNTEKIIVTASKYKGVPYVFGGVTVRGFDCSGYTKQVFAEHKINLPRMADQQYKTGQVVAKNSLKVADLVFFTTYEPGPSHVGIYAGRNKFWHVSSSKGVMLSDLNEDYWRFRYLGARRVIK